MSQLFQRKPIAALVEDTQGEQSLRRTLGAGDLIMLAIGAVIGTTVKGTRSIDERLALSGLAETLLTTLPDRTLLKPGRQTGETAGHRWRIDVAPMKVSAEGAQDARFIPLSVTLRLQAPGGAATQLTTVRLVARPTE